MGQSPVKRGAMSAAAMDWVREQVLSGALAPATVVRPEEVGRALGISPTPAREALQALKAEGFLSTQPGTGFVVEQLTSADIKDIFTAHAFLAGELTARAVGMAEKHDVDELEAIHFELLAAARRRRSQDVEDRNHEFHRRITHLAGSPKLAQILGIVSRYIPRSFYSEVEGWDEASATDHSAIIEAFRAQDPDAARRAMSDHITHAGDLLAVQFT